MSAPETKLPARGRPQVHRTPSGRAKVSKNDRAPSWHEIVAPHPGTFDRTAKPEPSETVTFTQPYAVARNLGQPKASRRERRQAYREVGIDPSAQLHSEERQRDSLVQGRARRRAAAATRARKQRKGQRAFDRQQAAVAREEQVIADLLTVVRDPLLEGTPIHDNATKALQQRHEVYA